MNLVLLNEALDSCQTQFLRRQVESVEAWAWEYVGCLLAWRQSSVEREDLTLVTQQMHFVDQASFCQWQVMNLLLKMKMQVSSAWRFLSLVSSQVAPWGLYLMYTFSFLFHIFLCLFHTSHNTPKTWTKLCIINPLSPNIHIQILQTDLYTCPSWMSWENLIKDEKHFPSGDHFINSHNLISWCCMDIVRRKLMLVTIGT